MKRVFFGALALLATLGASLGACSPQVAEQSAAPVQANVHPVSGLEVVPLAVTSLGKTHRFAVEIASTGEQQARGLMFRTEMGADEGMIFPYKQARGLSFWMRNTVIPLDIIFIGPDNRVINIAANTTPYSEAPILSDAPAIAVLEINAGRAKELGIVPGAKVEW